jgi:carboxylesterase
LDQRTVLTDWFTNELHAPFELTGDGGGVLMLHGFMGTPSELRPLATALNLDGFQVHVPLLPGFGRRVETLNQMTRADWIGEVAQLWEEMRRSGNANVLLGFSMGASIAMHLAQAVPPDRLILIAPLWKLMGGDWKLKLLPMAKRIVSEIRPFARADFSDPEVRRFFEGSMSSVDLEDPLTQTKLRTEIVLSTWMLDELRQLAGASGTLAPEILSPTLVIQGSGDQTVRLEHTRKLVGRFTVDVELAELPGDHLIVSDQLATWNSVQQLVRDFANGGRA